MEDPRSIRMEIKILKDLHLLYRSHLVERISVMLYTAAIPKMCKYRQTADDN